MSWCLIIVAGFSSINRSSGPKADPGRRPRGAAAARGLGTALPSAGGLAKRPHDPDGLEGPRAIVPALGIIEHARVPYVFSRVLDTISTTTRRAIFRFLQPAMEL